MEKKPLVCVVCRCLWSSSWLGERGTAESPAPPTSPRLHNAQQGVPTVPMTLPVSAGEGGAAGGGEAVPSSPQPRVRSMSGCMGRAGDAPSPSVCAALPAALSLSPEPQSPQRVEGTPCEDSASPGGGFGGGSDLDSVFNLAVANAGATSATGAK